MEEERAEILRSRSMEAPFNVPETMRVHDVIIASERDDGSWVLMFRKPEGLQGRWDVQTIHVPALSSGRV
jgi:hypothetical protein